MDEAPAPMAASAPAQHTETTPAVPSKTPSPSSKRSRDYGAELKGLTPSGDEGDGNRSRNSSPPAAKRQRVDEAAHGAEEQDAEDGEVTEASDASRRGSGASASSSSPEPSPKASGRSRAPAASAPALGYNPGISLGVRTSFAKGPAKGAAGAAPAKSTPLFASAPSRSPSPAASASSHKQDQDQDQDQDNEQDSESPQASEPTSSAAASTQGKSPSALASTFKVGEITWNVPPTVPFPVPKNAALRKPASWRSILDEWVTAFLKVNMEHVSNVDKQVLVQSLNAYIHANVRREKSGKNLVTKARSAATKMWLGMDQKALDKLIATCRQDAERELEEEKNSLDESASVDTGDSDEESEQEDGETSELDTEEELRQQQRYYPGAADPSQYCLFCSGTGHRAKDCAQRMCRFCSSFKHTSYGCPTKRRCSRCYELGHSSKSCTEKLALTAEERDPCAFCGAPHIEAECSEIWRSYNPGTVMRKTVQYIPTFCFTCGREGHYGSECGLPGRGPKIAGPTTWSQANRDLYIDPASQDVAIGWANVDVSSSRAAAAASPPAFHIRGHASQRRTHTHFVSSDDSDDGFIHEPVNRGKKPQQQQQKGSNKAGGAGSIRISSNIASSSSFPGRDNHHQSLRRRNEREFSPPPPPPPPPPQLMQHGAGYSGGGGNWQPPLPPGPPPPQPPSSGFVSLPPRPGRSGGGGGGGGGGGSSGRSNLPPRPRGDGGSGFRGGRGRGRGGGGGGGGGSGRSRGGRR